MMNTRNNSNNLDSNTNKKANPQIEQLMANQNHLMQVVSIANSSASTA
jgi:hypothetical protein